MLQQREQDVQRPRVKRWSGEFKGERATCSALESVRAKVVGEEAGEVGEGQNDLWAVGNHGICLSERGTQIKYLC